MWVSVAHSINKRLLGASWGGHRVEGGVRAGQQPEQEQEQAAA